MARNNLQDLLRIRSDQICGIKEAQIKGTADFVSGGLSSLATILGGVGAIVTGTTAARALSGSAGITSGVNGNITSTVYQDYVTSAITKAIDGARQTKWATIETQRSMTIDKYGVYEAVRDVNEYHQLCSFAAGLSQLTTQAEKLAPQQQTLSQGVSDMGTLQTQIKTNQDAITTLTNQLQAVPPPDPSTTANINSQISDLQATNAILTAKRRLIATRMQ